MSLSRRLPRPEVRLLARRPTGLELYQVLMPPLNPLALLTRPRDRAQLGGWPVMESARQLELAGPDGLKALLGAVLSAVVPVCLQRQCSELVMRLELEQGTPPMPFVEILPGFTLKYRYHRLTSLMSALRLRLETFPEDAGLAAAPMPTVRARGSSPWSFVPPFPSWFGEMFRSIFTPGTDPEIYEAVPFQLALLELIMAAGWQVPTLNILRREGRAVGMIMSRQLQPGRGELSFVGLLPQARGEPAVGRGLMAAGLEPLLSGGVETVVCAVAVDNPRSFAFFSGKWGFGGAGTEEVLLRRF